jgi:hypothetical protein
LLPELVPVSFVLELPLPPHWVSKSGAAATTDARQAMKAWVVLIAVLLGCRRVPSRNESRKTLAQCFYPVEAKPKSEGLRDALR